MCCTHTENVKEPPKTVYISVVLTKDKLLGKNFVYTESTQKYVLLKFCHMALQRKLVTVQGKEC